MTKTLSLAVCLLLALSVGGCGSCEGSADDGDSLDYVVDTMLIERLEALVEDRSGIADNQLSICVYDLMCDTLVYAFRPQEPIAPASCLKLLTATAALKYMGMDYEYRDSLFVGGEVQHGTLYGSVILRTDDDPLFATFAGFAQALKDEGIKRIEGDIVFDLARTDTLKAHPTAKTWDIPYHKLPLLLKGRTRIEQEWMYQLAAHGIRFRRNMLFAGHRIADTDPTATPLLHRLALDMARTAARPVAGEVHRLTEIVTPMLRNSSNIMADALYWHLNNVYGRLFDTDILHVFLRHELGLDYDSDSSLVVNDGSGLSPDNRLTTDFLVRLLRYVYADADIFRYYVGEALPTPCSDERHGTLVYRMANTPCVGHVFCKTGTLVTIGGSGLTGYALGSNGHWYAFSILNIDTPVADARTFQDRLCTELVK